MPNIRLGLPRWLSGKKIHMPMQETQETRLGPGLGRSPGGGNGNPLQYSQPGKSHGQRSLMGYSPKHHKELAMTEHTAHFFH